MIGVGVQDDLGLERNSRTITFDMCHVHPIALLERLPQAARNRPTG
jgi:hypothetical protein